MHIALLGTGTMGRVHAEAYATIPEARVVAVMGRDGAAADRLAATCDATAYSDLDSLLSHVGVDVVDCCLPTALHLSVVERVAAAGRHVICEKPLALTIEDGVAMIAACQAAGVHLLIAHVLRFVPPYRQLAAEIHAGRIGTPVSASLLRQGFYPAGREGWYRDSARSGGVFVDLMIHDFDWVLQQFGPADRVYARLVEHGLDGGQQPFSQGMATIRHRSGVLSQLTGTWGHPGPFTAAAEVAGTGGLLQYHMAETQPLRALMPSDGTGAGDVPLPDLSVGENPFRTQLSHFLDVIAGRAAPMVRPEQSLAALELALASRASAGRA